MSDGNQEALWELCKEFIKDHDIHCPETIYQRDSVIENVYEFIAGICEIVGYSLLEDEDDE